MPRQLVGLDASDDYLASAQESCRDLRVRFVAGDANVLSFPREASRSRSLALR